MYGVDFDNQLGDYLLDDKRKIPKAHLDSVCKIGQKEKTCRYISLSKIGYVCMKHSPAKEQLDKLVIQKRMLAQSDNCNGFGRLNDKD
jgi:hypothetical protein